MANVAEGILELLRVCGVHTIYGVTGDAVFPLFDALAKQGEGGIRFIGATDETAAAFMASYHAKLTGELGVCVASSGPGAGNLVNGLADAYFDGAPVLALTGQVASGKLGTGAKQEIDQQKLFSAVTKSSHIVVNGAAALHAVLRLAALAARERTVTHVAVPEDVWQQEIPAAPAVDVRTFAQEAGGFAGDLDEAVRQLRQAKRPLLVVGQRDVALREAVERLADVWGAGIVMAQQAKGLLPDEHPRVLGGVGEAYLPAAFHEADCVLQVGAVTFEKQYVDPNVTTVQALDKPDAIDPRRGSLALVGNLREILAALRDRLTLNDNAEWQEQISREKLHRSGLIDEQLANTSQPLHPAHVMAVLGDLVPADAVIVCDIGAHVHWFDSYFMANEQAVLISSRWRSLGAGLPGAIGAALAQPERTVVALVGDGGMLASLGALCTAVKYAVPVTVVIVNNRRYEIEAERMARRGMEPEGIDVPEPDFSALAASCGAWSRKVTSHDELTAAWHESRDVSGPVVLDVHVARAELPFLRG